MRGRFFNSLAIDPGNWRASLLTLILRVSLYLGFLIYLPSVYMAGKSDLVGVVIIDTVAVLIIFGLFYFDRIPFRGRATAFCLTCYFLGVGLLMGVGSISQIYLFGFSIITTLLLGLRAGLFSALLSSATLFVVGLLGYAAPEMSTSAWNTDFSGWLVTTLNFALVNLMLTLAIGAVLAALDGALNREIAARISLDQERKLLRTFVDALPDVVFTKDTSGRYVICNPAAVALVGLEREEQMSGKTVFELFPHEIAQTSYEDDLYVMAGSPIPNREENWIDRNGTSVWYLTIKVPMHDAAGKIVGLIGISRNITDRKRVEAERARLLAQLQLQIERMPLGYLISDREFRYTRWNPAAEQLFGYSEVEVLGKHPFDVIVPPNSQPLVASIFEYIKAGNMDAHGECENLTKTGNTIICEWHNTPMFDENGDFSGLMSLAKNITDRKRLEEQLRQSQKMEAVGKLAGGVAHDFNNLLTVISGYSELLLGLPEASDQIREPVKAISEAGERAAALTQQLLAFSRQTMLEPKVLDLNAVIAETGNMLRRLIGEDIKFTTVLDPKLSRVRVDPGQLDQVLMNLAVNARDAMPRGGDLTIETANIVLSDDYAATHLDCKAGHHVMLAVTDTGRGMTADVQARIFEPFYTTKDVGKGTGLGLAMVFGIVQQSGGCIHVYSEPDRGTTFKIYLPAVTEQLSNPSDSNRKLELNGTETILLVEDEDGVRKLAFTILQMYGYKVLSAENGSDALRIVQNHQETIDLLLTDVIMPNIGGPELAEKLRPRFPQIQILFMSGYTDDAVVRQGLLQAEVAFIQKPFTPLGLARKVRQVLDERKNAAG
ncbi:MAG: PAS domain S-box protein [Planctomycetes bacterium]|nr:PAS domain S-box protein [Planctomycetota bacterium]